MKFIILLLLATLCGCSSKLTVDIRILQRSYMTGNADVLSARLDASESALILAPSTNNRLKTELKARVQRYLQTYSCLYDKKQIPEIQAEANKRINTAVDQVNNALTQALQKRDTAALIIEPSAKKIRLMKEALNLIGAATSRTANIQGLVDIFIANDPTACGANVATVRQARQEVKQLVQEAQSTVTQSIVLALSDDPLASIAVSAPGEQWKYPINVTKAGTFFGNADMAVVMETNGGFKEATIKGIRNDASQATRALFSVLNVTVETIAGAYGMGFSTSKSDTAKNYIKETLETDSQREELNDNSRTAQVALLNMMLSQRTNLADDATYKAAVGKIQETFSSQKKKLTN